ncbi:MAG: hypothetical protein V4671_20075 [Armatimonadota bacterium]
MPVLNLSNRPSLRTRRCLLAAAVGAFSIAAGASLTGCGGGSSTTENANPNPTQTTRGRYGSLEFTLFTTGTYFPKTEADVPFVFTVKNTGSTPVTFGDAAPAYRAEIRQGDTLIWDRWVGFGFGAGFAMASLAPGETRRYEFRWNVKNNVVPVAAPGQSPVEAVPGTYRITAYSGMILEGVNNPRTQLAADPIDIVVR